MSDEIQVVESDRAVMPAVRPPGWRGRLIPSRDTPLTECPTSLDLSSPRGKALCILAGNPPTIEVAPGKDAHIRATDFLVYPDELVNQQTGELTQGCRVCLISADGETVKSTSEYVAHRLAAALTLYSKEEWRAGINFVVRCRPSKRHPGGSYHELRVELPT